MIPFRKRVLFLLGVSSLCLAGCGGPKVHAVRGQVVVEDGTIEPLANGHVELVSEASDTLRATGLIGPDGRFEVQSQIDGKLHRGAIEGKYLARVIPPQGGDDTDPPRRKKGKVRIDPRFYDVKTSGLVVDVPATGDVTVTVQTTKW